MAEFKKTTSVQNTVNNRSIKTLLKPKLKALSHYPQEGDAFAQYTQLHAIGKGASATVFKAYDPKLNRWVALKILNADLSFTEEMRLRFTREIKLLANLSIYGITAIFEQGQHQGFYYFSMEYVDGLTLDTHLASHNLSLNEKLALMSDLAKIVTELHSHKIYHRDIKPQNIMVDKKGKLRLMDLGIAKPEEAVLDVNVTQPGALVCTPAYMAPEQVNPDITDTDISKVDDYALGLIAYETLSGSSPYIFEGKKTLVSLHSCILNSEIIAPDTIEPMISKNISNTILKLLHKKPTKRASAKDFKTAVEQHLMLLKTQPIIKRRARTQLYITCSLLFIAALALFFVLKSQKTLPETAHKSSVSNTQITINKTQNDPPNELVTPLEQGPDRPSFNQIISAVQEQKLKVYQSNLTKEAYFSTLKEMTAPVEYNNQILISFKDLDEARRCQKYFRYYFRTPSNQTYTITDDGDFILYQIKDPSLYVLYPLHPLHTEIPFSQLLVPKSVAKYFTYKAKKALSAQKLKPQDKIVTSFCSFSNSSFILRINKLVHDTSLDDLQDQEFDSLTKKDSRQAGRELK